MTQTNKTQTTNMFARDYGLVLRNGTENLFVSPVRYALGATLAEAGKVHDVKRFGNNFTAVAESRSGEGSYALKFRVAQSGAGAVYTDHACPCPDNFWNSTKGLDALCAHNAALEYMLDSDNHSRASIKDNQTGLFPRHRKPAVTLPFALDANTIADIASRVSDGESHYMIDRDVLASPTVFSPGVSYRVESGSARFAVLPQRMRTIASDDLRATDRRKYQAVRALEERIGGELVDAGFHFEGYSLAFADSPFETIAKRFRDGATVYELATQDDDAPLLVRKELLSFNRNWPASRDGRTDALAARSAYVSVDDATRRNALTLVLKPGVNVDVFVPQVLQKEYAALG